MTTTKTYDNRDRPTASRLTRNFPRCYRARCDFRNPTLTRKQSHLPRISRVRLNSRISIGGPFGEVIKKTGAAAACPIRFSTKYQDETGLLYYIFRYYQPYMSWSSRDPINEGGFKVLTSRPRKPFYWNEEKSLYAFVNNSPTYSIDFLGLAQLKRNPNNSQTVTVRKCEVAILRGHGGVGRPHSFSGPSGDCWAGGFIGCYAKETNDSIGNDNRVPGSPNWDYEIADDDPDYLKAWTEIQQGAKDKAKEICKSGQSCCTEVTITFLYAPAYDFLVDLSQPSLPGSIKVKCK